MNRQIINPSTLADPRGYNHGILVQGGKLLFLAGQDAQGPDGSIDCPGRWIDQFERVILNLQAVVEEAGGTLDDIVKLNVFVADREEYLRRLEPLGTVFRSYFTGYPAMALFEVSGFFHEEALIEMEGMAVV